MREATCKGGLGSIRRSVRLGISPDIIQDSVRVGLWASYNRSMSLTDLATMSRVCPVELVLSRAGTKNI